MYAIVPSNASWGQAEKDSGNQNLLLRSRSLFSDSCLTVDSGLFGLKIAITQQTGNLGKGRG